MLCTPPAALRRTLTVTIIPVTFASAAAAPGEVPPPPGNGVGVILPRADALCSAVATTTPTTHCS